MTHSTGHRVWSHEKRPLYRLFRAIRRAFDLYYNPGQFYVCILEIARARGGVMRGWLLIRKGSLHTENHLLMIRVVNRDTRMAFTCGDAVHMARPDKMAHTVHRLHRTSDAAIREPPKRPIMNTCGSGPRGRYRSTSASDNTKRRPPRQRARFQSVPRRCEVRSPRVRWAGHALGTQPDNTARTAQSIGKKPILARHGKPQNRHARCGT